MYVYYVCLHNFDPKRRRKFDTLFIPKNITILTKYKPPKVLDISIQIKGPGGFIFGGVYFGDLNLSLVQGTGEKHGKQKRVYILTEQVISRVPFFLANPGPG